MTSISTATIGVRVAKNIVLLLWIGCQISCGDAVHRVSAIGLDVIVEKKTGAATLWVDEEPWLSLHEGIQVAGWGPLSLVSCQVTPQNKDPLFGDYTRVHFLWQGMDATEHVMETSFCVYEEQEMVVFEQLFPSGWTKPPKNSTQAHIIAGFPSISTHFLKEDLGYLVWGDCFLSETSHGNWSDLKTDGFNNLFDGHSHGQPLVLHSNEGRSVVWSNFDNFFVSGIAANADRETIDMGLRTSLDAIPENHRHTSIFLTGQGINATLMEWGAVLLKKGNKRRSQVYDDFFLAHAGYFTDNGAYHYHGAHQSQYANMEEALLGVQSGFRQQHVPIRYVQWDDWWMESKGDLPGMLSWEAKPDVFPSGFTNWLDMPLALYAPAYSGENVWINDYVWKTVQTGRGTSSIPLDPKFYVDLFRNGTGIGMKLFEQDFLCSEGIGGSGLTSRDVGSGRIWLEQMNHAALAFNVTLQLCMPDGYHILQSTTLQSVTNARATYDNTRNAPSVLSMGQNSLLFNAVGIFASRDNVWTSNADVEQKGCGNKDFCYEPNVHLDNAATVLSNGPYGIADAVDQVNRTIVMYACRPDGFMLRPRWPLASLDFTFLQREPKGSKVWAAHDDFGAFRWSYIVGIKITTAIAITPIKLVQGAFAISPTQQMVAWEVVPGEPVTRVQVFSGDSPFLLPSSEPLNLPYDIPTPPHTHYAAAPVLPNGMVILGETNKWTTLSFGRLASFHADKRSVVVELIGAPAEVVTYSYLKSLGEDSSVYTLTYQFPASCSEVDSHGNSICRSKMSCTVSAGCFLRASASAAVVEV